MCTYTVPILNDLIQVLKMVVDKIFIYNINVKISKLEEIYLYIAEQQQKVVQHYYPVLRVRIMVLNATFNNISFIL